MKNLFKLGIDLGNRYAAESNWKDFALLKLCLFALGIVIGTQVAPNYKKIVISTSIGIFIATYVPLMSKVFKIITIEKEN